MKIVILGGAGGQGLYTTKELIRGVVFNDIVVASRNLDRTEEIVNGLGSDKVSAAQVDVMNQDELVALIKDADVVANCTGPFYLLCEHVLNAAIEAEVNYIDFCDDVAVHQKIFAKDYHERAKEKGISLVIGLGASPGLAPLGAMAVAQGFDEIESITFNVAIDNKDDSDGPAVLYHIIENFMMDIPVVRDGVLTTEKPWVGAERYDFQGPIGEILISTIGHPEPFTLNRALPEAQNVTVKLGYFPSPWFETLKDQIEDGLASDEPLMVNGEEIAPRDLLVQHLIDKIHNPEEEVERILGEPISGTVMEVIGRKGDDYIEYKSYSYGQMGPLTGYPLAIGAEMLATGDITMEGLMVPEECIEDPVEFLMEFRKRSAASGHTSIGKDETKISKYTSGQEHVKWEDPILKK